MSDPTPIASDSRQEALMLFVMVATEEWQREEGYSKAEVAEVAAMLHGKPL